MKTYRVSVAGCGPHIVRSDNEDGVRDFCAKHDWRPLLITEMPADRPILTADIVQRLETPWSSFSEQEQAAAITLRQALNRFNSTKGATRNLKELQQLLNDVIPSNARLCTKSQGKPNEDRPRPVRFSLLRFADRLYRKLTG